jgi:hypothetical protein
MSMFVATVRPSLAHETLNNNMSAEGKHLRLPLKALADLDTPDGELMHLKSSNDVWREYVKRRFVLKPAD